MAERNVTLYMSIFMSAMYKKIGVLILIQLVAIAVLTIRIIHAVGSSPSRSVIPLKKEDLLFPAEGSLRNYYEPKPKSQWVYPTTEWLNYENALTVNRDGLYERFDYPKERSPGVYRIVTLGDSFTAGVLLPRVDDNWTEKLEEMYNAGRCGATKIEVINMGVGGYDARFSYNRFLTKAASYHPDLVIWLLQDNDFSEDSDLFVDLELKIRKELVKSGEYERQLRKGLLSPEAKLALIEMEKVFKERGDEIEKREKEAISSLKKTFKGKLVFATFSGTADKYKSFLKTLEEKDRVYSLVSLTDLKTPDVTFLPHDYHPNKKGHSIIAEEISSYLRERGLLTCP